MQILQKCPSCNKRKFLIYRRLYRHKAIGEVRSQKELCGQCFKIIKDMAGLTT